MELVLGEDLGGRVRKGSGNRRSQVMGDGGHGEERKRKRSIEVERR